MQETRTFFQSKRKRMTQKFWEGRGDKAKTKQVAEMNTFNLAKTEWLSCSLILPCSGVGALNASPPTGEWSQQVNSAQLHPVPRWIKGKNTDTPTCQKGEQVGKQREKKKKRWAPTVWLVQLEWDVFPVCCFTALAWVRLATCLLPPLNAERSTKINSVVLQLIWHVDVSWGPSEKSLSVLTVHQPESSGNTAWFYHTELNHMLGLLVAVEHD